MRRHATQQERIGQRLGHIHRVQLACDLDGQALARVGSGREPLRLPNQSGLLRPTEAGFVVFSRLKFALKLFATQHVAKVDRLLIIALAGLGSAIAWWGFGILGPALQNVASWNIWAHGVLDPTPPRR